MIKNVMQRKCFYFNLFIIIYVVAHLIVIEVQKYLKNRETIDYVNSHLKNINLYIDKCKKNNINYMASFRKIKPISKPKITALIAVLKIL